MSAVELVGAATVVAAVTMVLLVVALGYLLADRSARRHAWRRIAEERRWIRERSDSDPDG